MEIHSRGVEKRRSADPHVESGIPRSDALSCVVVTLLRVMRDKLDSGFLGTHRAGTSGQPGVARAGAVWPPHCPDGHGPCGPCRQSGGD